MKGWSEKSSLKREPWHETWKERSNQSREDWTPSGSRRGILQMWGSWDGNTWVGRAGWRLNSSLQFLAPKFSPLGDVSVLMFLAIMCYLIFENQTRCDSEPRLWSKTQIQIPTLPLTYCVAWDKRQPLWQFLICKNGLTTSTSWSCCEK